MIPVATIVRNAMRAVRIVSDTRFAWLGRRSPRVPNAIVGTLSTEARNAYLKTEIAQRLYGWYTTGADVPCDPPPVQTDAEDAVFADDIRRAAHTKECWQAGWEEETRRNGSVLARRGQACFVAEPADLRRNGDKIEVRIPAVQSRLSPGFIVVHGARTIGGDVATPVVRLYWHLHHRVASPWVEQTTRLLNEMRVPFQLKVLAAPQFYSRCDAGVLYLTTDAYRHAGGALRAVYGAVRPGLGRETVLFGKPLGPGLSLAESPLDGDSFGMHRCRLLAQAIVSVHRLGIPEESGRLAATLDHLRHAGVVIDSPYLNPGSEDSYDVFAQSAVTQVRDRTDVTPRPGTQQLREQAETAAARISETFANSAIRYRRRCTWIGEEVGHSAVDDRVTTLHRPLPPFLYSGCSGVALYLAEFARLTGDSQARELALAALRQASAQHGALPREQRWSLYTGTPGIVVASCRIGAALGDQEATDLGKKLVRDLLADDARPRGDDPLEGAAGAIVGLLEVHSHWPDERLLNKANEIGNDVISRAHRAHGTLHWKGSHEESRRGLTGFAHGAAGIGYALARLAEHTDDVQFAAAGRAAFAYERRHLDETTGNWADLTKKMAGYATKKGNAPASIAWCHGAPGIALSRIGSECLADEALIKTDAELALACTDNAVRAGLQSDLTDLCLCHGAAGHADVLIDARRLGRAPDPGCVNLVTRVAERAIDALGTPSACVFDGRGAADARGLMTGVAGVGYFLLRVIDADVPSVLLPGAPPAQHAGARALSPPHPDRTHLR